MKIYVQKILDEGLELNESISNELIEERDDDHLKFIEPIELKVRLDKTGNDVFAKVNANGKFSSSCSRCLEEVERDYNTSFDLEYKIDRSVDTIDMTDDIRQEIFLNLASKILCNENCKGICPKCGANLNKEKCKCK
jgi:uncharacterized protein